MKNVVRIMLALALAVTATLGRASQAQAQPAKGAAWQSSITVMNVNGVPATITIDFYPGNGGAPISFQPDTKLNAEASTSYSLSSIAGITAGFKGSAVIYSDQRLASTMVQFVQGGLDVNGRNVRPLSNGFLDSDASLDYLIPTVLNNQFNTVTEFSIQNVETTNITATVSFFAVDVFTPTMVRDYIIRPNEAQLVDASAIGLPSPFNGSARVKAARTFDGRGGNVVATINEYNTINGNASSVEATKNSDNRLYMPIALCNLTGPNTATSSYAIQNADEIGEAVVGVQFFEVNSSDVLGKTIPPFTLQPGGKRSINACTDAGLPNGFNGSAVIRSTGAKVVAVGKVSGGGLSTAFLANTGSGGALVLPYVRWSPEAQFAAGTRQRTFISIQNVSGWSGDVTVSYRDARGYEVAKKTYTIRSGQKVNTNPKEAGAAPNDVFGEVNGTFGGSVVINSSIGMSIAAVARVTSGRGPKFTGEDYSAVPKW